MLAGNEGDSKSSFREMISTVVILENWSVRREMVWDGGYRDVDFVVMIHSHRNAN